LQLCCTAKVKAAATQQMSFHFEWGSSSADFPRFKAARASLSAASILFGEKNPLHRLVRKYHHYEGTLEASCFQYFWRSIAGFLSCGQGTQAFSVSSCWVSSRSILGGNRR